jgi:hypothetical protein
LLNFVLKDNRKDVIILLISDLMKQNTIIDIATEDVLDDQSSLFDDYEDDDHISIKRETSNRPFSDYKNSQQDSHSRTFKYGLSHL